MFDLCSETECVKFKIYKLHEDEHGKFHIVAGSSNHVCNSEWLNKGIGVNVH